MSALFPTLLPLLLRVHQGITNDLAAAPHPDLLQSFFSQGKLFRPLLTLIGAGAVGGDPERAVVLAQSIELFHGASLVHDDIIDRANTRRGQPALHVALSTDVALVLGDYLLLRAVERLTEIEVESPTIVDAVRLVAGLARRCCRGQIDELQASNQHVTEEQYVSIVRDKTGAFFATSLAGGALVAGASPEQVQRLARLGDLLGVIFQIYDDVLDIVGNANELGKPIGNSVSMLRPHVAWVYLAQTMSQLAAQPVSRVEVLAHMQEHGIWQRIQALQDRCIAAAEQEIAELPSSDHAVGLRKLARHLASWADDGEIDEGETG